MLAINDDAVAIKSIEVAIVERAFARGMDRAARDGARGGPARGGRRVRTGGLAAASQLKVRGHDVTRVRARRGPRRPDALRRARLQARQAGRRPPRRAARARGGRVPLQRGRRRDITRASSGSRFDAVVLAIGARVARELPLPGRELAGVRLAMDYLYGRNRSVAARLGRPARRSPSRSVPKAATSSSSGAATRRWIASATPTASGPRA